MNILGHFLHSEFKPDVPEMARLSLDNKHH